MDHWCSRKWERLWKTARLCPSGRLPESMWRDLAYIFNKPSKWVHREPKLLTAQLWNVASRAPVRLMRRGLVKMSLHCRAHCKNEEVLKYLALRRYTVKSPYIYLVWRLTKWIVTILHGDVIGVAVIPVTMRWGCVWYPLALLPQRLRANYIMWQTRPVSLFSMVYKMYCVDFGHHCSLGSDWRVSWLEGAEMSIGTYVCASLWSQREALQAADSTEHREVAEIRIWIPQHSQLWVVLAHILGHNTSSFFQETRFGLVRLKS